jgi:phosphoglycolate phosphatase
VKLLLFDVDLTLISTGGAGLRALNRACEARLALRDAMAGISPSGKTDPSIVREIFAARSLQHNTCSLDDIIDLYLIFLREEVETTTDYRVLPGILNVLDEMSTRSDVLLGLATGNVESGARIKLERGDLNRYFRFGGFGSDSENRTALVRRAAELASMQHGTMIDSQNIFVIGDTPLDVAAGREAGFRTVGVATGKFSMDELRDCGAELTIEDFERGRDQFLRTTFIE